MPVFFKVAVAFICDFLVPPASDGRYSTGHQEVPPKWNHRDGWKTADHHHKVQNGDRHGDAGGAERFPHRNRALGRDTTSTEQKFGTVEGSRGGALPIPSASSATASI
jgi:hypothetical protein